MSNSASWAELFAPINAHNREMAFRDTWGHLAPEKNVTYRSKILFCVSEYNSIGTCLISDGMPNSPWMFDAIHEYINSFDKIDAGVYEIKATLRNYRFWGKPVKVI